MRTFAAARTAALVLLLVAALLVAVAGPAASASAVEYPSWEDLQRARTDARSKALEVARIRRLLDDSERAAAEARAAANERGAVYASIREQVDAANDRLVEIEQQVEASREEATEATRRAARLVAQLTRAGGADLEATMLLYAGASADETTSFLRRLGSLSKLTETNGRIAERARQARDAAAATQAQAEEQRKALQVLQDRAREALDEAVRASDEADREVERQQQVRTTLTVQLRVLESAEETTREQYEAGVEAAERERKAAEAAAAERERKAAEAAAAERERKAEAAAAERRRKAQQAAAAERERQAAAADSDTDSDTDSDSTTSPEGGSTSSEPSGSSGSSGSSTSSGSARSGASSGSAGWARPGNGRITSRYGPRPDRPAGANAIHRGVDLAAACSAPTYAAAAGTVRYAGWLGTYGYFVEIDHGGGISTGYAHFRAGGIAVRNGDRVTAGQYIGAAGTTGASTGCHTHFETRMGGTAVDPIPFLAARGVSLG